MAGIRSRLVTGGLLAWGTGRAGAHADAPPEPHDLWHTWDPDIGLWLAFVLGVGLYLRGLRRLWRRAGAGRGVGPLQLSSFGVGILLLACALLSPLDALGEALSAAHMAQHMLILFAAPFLVMAAPLPVYLWGLPRSWRRRLGSGAKHRGFNWLWRYVSAPFTAWSLLALALWIWHAPILYQAALDRAFVHDLEHFSFLAAGLLFWWVVFRTARRTTGLMLIFTTMLHSGLLGALMTFSTRPWYPNYLDTTAVWGLTPLEDQQTAGLLMWIPGGLGYLLAGLALLASWLQRLERADYRPKPLHQGE